MDVAIPPRRMVILAALLGTCLLAAVFHEPLRWVGLGLRRDLFPEQNPERPVYDGTAKSPQDLAVFVADAQRAWPQANAGVVHAAAFATAEGLLQHADIEVGSVADSRFSPWAVAPWTAAARIKAQLRGATGFYAERGHIVFRRKTT